MIPLVVTMDLEIAHDHDLDEQQNVLSTLCSKLKTLNLPITAFTTSEAATYFPDEIRKLMSNGNEIGCHGLRHRSEENYRKMSADLITEYIESSTYNIEGITNVKPVSFRGPGMSTSTDAQRVLINNGYSSDFSVCSQRVDITNSRGGELSWLISPRCAYHPSGKSPYTKGDLPIWVVPLSCIGLPFISGILYLFGLNFMKLFFRVLLNEAKRKNNPIVYMFHSYEFCGFNEHEAFEGKSCESGKSKRKLIHRLYEIDRTKRFEMNISLLRYMLSFDQIRPFTANEYINSLNR